LITGETGTGKELIAERIHRLSNLSGEYVTVNVAGLDDTLFSDVLFGHKKGAFTGADTHREGLLEKAEGGTIFLDEIGDLSMASQVKLLRLLQEREYYPLGSDNKKRTNARFVVATSREVRSMMADGSFRKDLYYRLQAHQIHLPALRERKGDIPMLLEAFAASAAKDCGKDTPKFPSSIVKILMDYSFAGNIRELEAMVFNAVSTHDLSHEFLQPESFLRDIQLASGEVFELKQYEEPSVLPWIDTESELPTIDECVDQLIELTLERCGHNQTATAKALGITRQGLLARLKRKKKE
jgi:transcriptional regulator with PAS, ATPase and Fis domain